MIYYKWCYFLLKDNTYRSSQLSSQHPYCRIYKIGKWTSGYKNTPLMVFASKNDALDFLSEYSRRYFYPNQVLFECKIKNIRKYKYIADIDEINNFWKNKNNHRRTNNMHRLPPKGTILVDKVKLIKKLCQI